MNLFKRFALLSSMFLFPAAVVIAAPGDLDPSFGTGGKVVLSASTSGTKYRGVREFPDGKLIVFGGENYIIAKRLNSDGSTDLSWGWAGSLGRYGVPANPYVPGYALDLDVLPDGRIIVVGKVKLSSTDTEFKPAMWRFDANGIIDETFGTDGRLLLSSTEGAAAEVEEDGGKYYVLYARSDGTYLTRRHSTGSPDFTFGSLGQKRLSYSSSLIGSTDLKITPSGKVLSVLGTMKRFNTDGSADATFGSSGTADPIWGLCSDQPAVASYAVSKVNVGVFGKLAVTGLTIYNVSGSPLAHSNVSAYFGSGSVDTAFNSGKVLCQGTNWGSAVWSEAIYQLDGRMVFATAYDDPQVIRLNSDGTRDTSYVAEPVTDWFASPVDLLLQRLDEKAVVLYEREIHRRLR